MDFVKFQCTLRGSGWLHFPKYEDLWFPEDGQFIVIKNYSFDCSEEIYRRMRVEEDQVFYISDQAEIQELAVAVPGKWSVGMAVNEG